MFGGIVLPNLDLIRSPTKPPQRPTRTDEIRGEGATEWLPVRPPPSARRPPRRLPRLVVATPPSAARSARKAAETRAQAELNTLQVVQAQAERALLIPVGAALEARDAVIDVPSRTSTVARAPRRSSRAFRSASAPACASSSVAARPLATARSREVKRTRTRVERELRQRRNKAVRTVKQNRRDVEKQVKPARREAESQVEARDDRLARRSARLGAPDGVRTLPPDRRERPDPG